MTKPILTDELAQYFELRDKVAALLKEAGVKKRARHYVAEVLIDAGVIDFAELDEAVALETEASLVHPDPAEDERVAAMLAELEGKVIPGYGVVMEARVAEDGSGAEALVRSADFEESDRWVSLAEILGH